MAILQGQGGPGLEGLHSESELLVFQHPNMVNNEVGSRIGVCSLGSPLGRPLGLPQGLVRL